MMMALLLTLFLIQNASALPAEWVAWSPVFHLLCRYYHGRISRDEAVSVLQRDGSDGSFLLRMSETQDGVYTVSVLFVLFVVIAWY